MTATLATSITAIAANRAQPWRRLPTIRPKVAVRAAGISRMNSSSTKFENAVGFSNGIEELTLKKPPPLVPSCLIDTWEATGPSASPCAVPRVWMTPCETSTTAPAKASGSRMYRRVRVRSLQKLPRFELPRDANPLITAARTAIPTAAETKF